MKKILAIVLALVLAFAMTAFADEPTYTDATSVTVTKVYKLAGEGTSPAETFTLEQIGDGKVTSGDATSAPALGTITGAAFAAGAANADGAEANITITLPSYEKVGVYEYTLKEVAGSTAGVTYYGGDIKLVVTVINGADGKLRVAAVHTEAANETKKDSFENTYSANSLSISKTVTGNLGDKTKYFEFKVTLTGETGKTYGESYAVSGGSYDANPKTIAIGTETTFYLKDKDTIKIENLPAGVTYTVTEAAAEGYTTTKIGDTGTISANAASEAKFTNDKTSNVDTGITMDSIPYVVLMALAVVGIAVLAMKKRREA